MTLSHFRCGYRAPAGQFANPFMKILFTLTVLCFALNTNAATYMLLSQTNAFAAGITNAAKAYADTKAPLASPALTGTPTINGQSMETQLTNRIAPLVITYTHAGTVTMTNTAWLTKAYLAPTGNVTFATSDLTAGHDYIVFLRNVQATNIVLTFPQNGGTNAWQFQGGAITNIPSGQTFTLSTTSVGTVDTNVWAACAIIQ